MKLKGNKAKGQGTGAEPKGKAQPNGTVSSGDDDAAAGAAAAKDPLDRLAVVESELERERTKVAQRDAKIEALQASVDRLKKAEEAREEEAREQVVTDLVQACTDAGASPPTADELEELRSVLAVSPEAGRAMAAALQRAALAPQAWKGGGKRLQTHDEQAEITKHQKAALERRGFTVQLSEDGREIESVTRPDGKPV